MPERAWYKQRGVSRQIPIHIHLVRAPKRSRSTLDMAQRDTTFHDLTRLFEKREQTPIVDILGSSHLKITKKIQVTDNEER